MYEDLYVINGKVTILTSLLGGKEPSAEVCDVTPEDFAKICEELENEGLIRNANFIHGKGNAISAEVTGKGIKYFDRITNRLKV
ncbi:MAG: hypothetical protein ACQEWV_12535 [Bacillota bacterium]